MEFRLLVELSQHLGQMLSRPQLLERVWGYRSSNDDRLVDVTVRRLYTDYVPKGLFHKHRDIVVLSRVESDPVTSQLGGFAGYAVDKINGVEVTDFQQAYELLHPETPPEFHVIELFGASRPVVIPSADVKEANERVARNYGIARLANLKD